MDKIIDFLKILIQLCNRNKNMPRINMDLRSTSRFSFSLDESSLHLKNVGTVNAKNVEIKISQLEIKYHICTRYSIQWQNTEFQLPPIPTSNPQKSKSSHIHVNNVDLGNSFKMRFVEPKEIYFDTLIINELKATQMNFDFSNCRDDECTSCLSKIIKSNIKSNQLINENLKTIDSKLLSDRSRINENHKICLEKLEFTIEVHYKGDSRKQFKTEKHYALEIQSGQQQIPKFGKEQHFKQRNFREKWIKLYNCYFRPKRMINYERVEFD